MARIFSPTVPLHAHLGSPFVPGSKIQIDGFVNENAGHIGINLKNATSIVAHINPRFNDNVIVFNASIGGHWGGEERIPMPPFLHKGAPFTFLLSAEAGHLEVVLNGRPIHQFRNRASLAEVNQVEVNGDVHLSLVQETTSRTAGEVHQLLGRTQYQQGRHVYVRGRADQGANWAVNLKRGNDILFHYNVRQNDNCVVRNSCIGGGWGSEERTGGAPTFNPSGDFEIHMIVYPGRTTVIFNGREHVEFNNRGWGPEAIDSVELKGATLYSIRN